MAFLCSMAKRISLNSRNAVGIRMINFPIMKRPISLQHINTRFYPLTAPKRFFMSSQSRLNYVLPVRQNLVCSRIPLPKNNRCDNKFIRNFSSKNEKKNTEIPIYFIGFVTSCVILSFGFLYNENFNLDFADAFMMSVFVMWASLLWPVILALLLFSSLIHGTATAVKFLKKINSAA